MHGAVSKTVFSGLRSLRVTSLLLLTLAAGVAFFLTYAPPKACASALQTACDPEFMDAMEARGFLEAQRQIEQNNNLIFQQDSVLEYTCFDQWMGHVGDDGMWGFRQPFTDTGYSGSHNGTAFNQSGGALYGSLSKVVWTALKTYLVNNYGNGTNTLNKYLGQRDGNPSWTVAAAAPMAAYNCKDMENVWKAAHCMNFFDQPTHDAFYDFYWYSSAQNKGDARHKNYNNAWANPGNECTPVINDTGDIEVAFNGQGTKFSLNPENPWQSHDNATPYTADPVLTRLNLILTVGSGAPSPGNCNTVQPIPTGVCVIREGLTAVYKDAFCPNPACHYVYPNSVNIGHGADPTNCGTATIGTCAPP